MFKRFLAALPSWAQVDHPVLRYMLQRYQPSRRLGWRLVRIVVQALSVAILIVFGYQVATEFGTQPVGSLHAILYWPLTFFGLVVGLAAMSLTGNVISTEKTRGTWDSLRITSHGAGLVFQARWVAVFYSLRGPLAVLLLTRILFVVGILIDLAQYYRGRYLDLLLSGTTPHVSVTMGAVLLAATMTAGIMQPLVALGLDGAVGLLLSVTVRSPRYDIMVRIVIGLLRVGLAGLVIALGTQVFVHPENLSEGSMWLRVVGQSMLGDQGLRLLNIEESGFLWVELPYSIYLGPVLLLFTLLQAWLAGFIVNRAARLAQRAE